MSKDLSAKYYQKIKEGLKKVFSEEEKGKSEKMVVNDIKFFLGMKSKGQLIIEKGTRKCEKIKSLHK